MLGCTYELRRFILVGIGSNLINYITYLCLVSFLGTSLIIASLVGYMTGFINSYYFGKNWVFNARDTKFFRTTILFSLVYSVGAIGMATTIEVLNRYFFWDYRLAWFIGATFAFGNNFLGSKWIVFRN